jgi:hypothetical protein
MSEGIGGGGGGGGGMATWPADIIHLTLHAGYSPVDSQETHVPTDHVRS